jgi:hypothetical protein
LGTRKVYSSALSVSINDDGALELAIGIGTSAHFFLIGYKYVAGLGSSIKLKFSLEIDLRKK